MTATAKNSVALHSVAFRTMHKARTHIETANIVRIGIENTIRLPWVAKTTATNRAIEFLEKFEAEQRSEAAAQIAVGRALYTSLGIRILDNGNVEASNG